MCCPGYLVKLGPLDRELSCQLAHHVGKGSAGCVDAASGKDVYKSPVVAGEPLPKGHPEPVDIEVRFEILNPSIELIIDVMATADHPVPL